jgi:hypothetical protein
MRVKTATMIATEIYAFEREALLQRAADDGYCVCGYDGKLSSARCSIHAPKGK